MSTAEDFCAIHGYEPIPPNAYRVCGECWHAWPSYEAFHTDCKDVADDMTQHGYPMTTLDVVNSNSCPLCTHDF